MLLARKAENRLLYWAASGFLAAACIPFILYLDKPVAEFWNMHQRLRPLFQLWAAPSLLSLPVSGLILLWALIRHLRGHALPDRLWMALALSTLASTAAKDELKWMFGRAWPGTWLKYGIYNFEPFTQSILFGGFPSGHTSYIAAPMGVLWALRPQYRLLWGGIVFMVMTGLVCADYHFVSDVFAGLLTGGFCAWGTLVLTEKRHG